MVAEEIAQIESQRNDMWNKLHVLRKSGLIKWWKQQMMGTER